MHVLTVVKVIAQDEAEAIALVNDLLTENDYAHYRPFDYCDEDNTVISEEVITEEQFQGLRAKELERYQRYLQQALALPDENSMKSYYLCRAGECLDEENFWVTERLAYDYTWNQEGEEDGKAFYVVTDRHH